MAYSADGTHQVGIFNPATAKKEFIWNYVSGASNNKPEANMFARQECWFSDISADGYSDGVDWFLDYPDGNETGLANPLYVVDTISDLSTIPVNYTTVMVKDVNRGGTFNWFSYGVANAGTIFAGLSGFWHRQYTGDVNIKWFGAIGDGVTNDTVAISQLATITDGIDGKGGTFVVNTATYIPLVTSRLANCNFIVNGVLFNLSGLVDFELDNCTFDGKRGTFTELWNKFSSYYDIDSIEPSVDKLIKTNIYTTKDITVSNCKFTNIFNECCLTISSHGTVLINDCIFSNIANKTFHVFHDVWVGEILYNTTGNTLVNNIVVDNIGILPDSFSYYNGSTTTTVAWGSVNMPMPQGAFCNIVTCGSFSANNVTVNDYATTAITFDRNYVAIGNNIKITCDNIKAVSNNPAAGLWNEFCDTFECSNVFIKIINRGYFHKCYAIQNAIKVNSRTSFTNITVEQSSTANVWQCFTNSTQGGAETFIDNLLIDDNEENPTGFFYNYLSDAVAKDRLYITNSDISTYRLMIAPCEKLSISNSRIHYTYGAGIFNYDGGVAGISDLQEFLMCSNVTFSGTGFVSSYHVKKAFFDNCIFGVENNEGNGFVTDASIYNLNITNSRINGRLLCPYNYSISLSNNIITKRVELFETGIDRTKICTITGNIIGNNESATTLFINPLAIAGTVSGNVLLIYTGVQSAAYINSPTDVTITGNCHKQIEYLL